MEEGRGQGGGLWWVIDGGDVFDRVELDVFDV